MKDSFIEGCLHNTFQSAKIELCVVLTRWNASLLKFYRDITAATKGVDCVEDIPADNVQNLGTESQAHPTFLCAGVYI